jgi:hypothetical protein
MASAVVLATLVLSISASAQDVRTLGTFAWDISTADVLVQRVATDRIVVQVRIATEWNSTPGGRHQTRGIPTEAMEAWVLLDGGTTLEQTPRDRPKGAPPVGVSNAGTIYSFVTFGFTAPPRAKPVAVAVQMEDHLYVFPWNRGQGPSDPVRQPRSDQ